MLDVGCGPGSITADLGERVAPGTVPAIDPSPSVVEQAAAHCRERGLENVEVTVGDVHALDPADGRFDVVHAHQVLQHLRDPVEPPASHRARWRRRAG